MKLKSTLACLALLFLAACGGAPDSEHGGVPDSGTPSVLAPGDYNKTIAVGSELRSYILHVPPGYDGSTPLPLVYVLHGHGGTAAGMIKLTGMSAKADQENFFVAYLQAVKGADGVPDWNTGMNPSGAVSVDDAEFVRELTLDVAGQVKLDSTRVYATGLSMGGAMSHRLGAELPDVLAAVAPVAGAVGNSEDGGVTFHMIPPANGPISILIIHGMQDTHVLYYGGQGEIPELNVKPVSDAVGFWTEADGCTGLPIQTNPASNVFVDDYTPCTNGSEVELISIEDGQHEWPSAATHTHFSATDAIWDFFSRHSKTVAP